MQRAMRRKEWEENSDMKVKCKTFKFLTSLKQLAQEGVREWKGGSKTGVKVK